MKTQYLAVIFVPLFVVFSNLVMAEVCEIPTQPTLVVPDGKTGARKEFEDFILAFRSYDTELTKFGNCLNELRLSYKVVLRPFNNTLSLDDELHKMIVSMEKNRNWQAKMEDINLEELITQHDNAHDWLLTMKERFNVQLRIFKERLARS